MGISSRFIARSCAPLLSLALACTALAGCSKSLPPAPSETSPRPKLESEPRPALAGLGPLTAEEKDRPRTSGATAGKDKSFDDTAPLTDELAHEPRRLLARLPKDTLVALRLPEIESLGEAWRRTSFASLYDQPEARAEMDAALDKMRAELDALCAKTPELAKVLELRSELRGEVVVAITAITPPTTAAGQSAAPIAASVLFETERADQIQNTIDPLLATLAAKRDKSLDFARKEGAWGFEIGDETFYVDVLREKQCFSVLMGQRKVVRAQRAEPMPYPRERSFLASDIVGATREASADGARPVAELFVNCDPLWVLAKRAAPGEVFGVLRRSGLIHVDGVSIAMALGESGLSESFNWCSTGCSDMLSRALLTKPLERSLARYVPADADGAGLYAFDVSTFAADLLAVLPEEPRRQLERGLGDLRRFKEIDLFHDVIENVGPTFAVMTRGDLMSWSRAGGPKLCVAVQLAHHERIDELLAFAMRESGGAANVRTESANGVKVSSIEMPSELGPIAICWCTTQDAFLLGIGRDLFTSALAGATAKETRNAALRDALARADDKTFAIGLNAGAAGRPATVSFGRRTSTGFVIEAQDGSGSLNGMFGGFAILSSVAIPKLLAARLDANEHAAAATMRYISSCEAMAESAACVDIDGDDQGEYLFIDEMNGRTRLRGGGPILEPKLLDGNWSAPQQGASSRSGYVFRVELPGRRGTWTALSTDRSGRDVSPDDAEIQWIAYAWPLQLNQTGNKVFALDQEGDLWWSDNLGPQQGYSGFERAPKTDAFHPAQAKANVESESYVGRDGGTWHLIPWNPPDER